MAQKKMLLEQKIPMFSTVISVNDPA